MLPRRCILCCDMLITRSWHGRCVSSNALKATKPWQAGSLNGLLRNGRISSSIGKTVWSGCLPDGSRVRRELHARFCERPVVKFHRPTQPLDLTLNLISLLFGSTVFLTLGLSCLYLLLAHTSKAMLHLFSLVHRAYGMLHPVFGPALWLYSK